MGNLNKIISLVIGLVIVVIIFAVITGRINIRKQIMRLSAKNPTVSPTPSIIPKLQTKPGITPTPTLSYKVNQYQQGSTIQTNQIVQIPSTGIPIIFYPSLLAVLYAGIHLRKKK